MSKEKKKKVDEDETEDILAKLKEQEKFDEIFESEEEFLQQESNEKLDKVQQEYEKLNDSYLRLYADFDNYKKRVNKEKTEISAYAISGIMSKLIEVKDNFERALTTDDSNDTPFYNGMKMVAKQLEDILSTEGLSAIKAVGELFDPNLHYAVMTESNPDYKDDIVLEELQTGYLYKEKIIRPAMVKVNKL